MDPKVDIRQSDGFFKGSDFFIEFQTLQEDGTPENITGFALAYTLWKHPDDTTALLTKTVGSGIVITDAPNGIGRIIFVPADTATLKSGVYFHKLARTDANFYSSILPGKGYKSATVQLLPQA